ncbi:MAG TPA: FAD-dependent oxidoreductase [Acidimicrobiia bacterium]|nr:FAD-dependent oxidoreductase [Acidimicrobiia bacterium]
MKTLIIGSGPAGLTVAEELRALAPESDIVMVSTEPFAPYAPPAMADYFLTGREETLFWKGRDICDRLEIDFRPSTPVEGLRPGSNEVVLGAGQTIGYDNLVLASGSRLHSPIGGSDLAGVFDFKSLSAATALVDAVRKGTVTRAVIVGAGFIGVEVALLLRDLGVEVTQVEMSDRVMPRMLDPETAEIVLAEMHRRGVEVLLETKAVAFQGARPVEAVELESGRLLAGDAFIAATGVKPNVEFMDGSGVDMEWGIRVDDHLRTNLPGVYAAGDVAQTMDRMTGESYVHAIFPNAVAQARVVARNLAGIEETYAGSENMNSLKHLGVQVMAVGAPSGDRELRMRRNGILRKVFLTDDRIVGFRLAGDISGAGVLRSLMLKGVGVGPYEDRLVTPGFGIGDLVLTVPSVVR